MYSRGFFLSGGDIEATEGENCWCKINSGSCFLRNKGKNFLREETLQMRTDLEKPQGNGWEQSSNFVRQQSAEEVIKRRKPSDSPKRKPSRNSSRKLPGDRDKMFLIAGIVGILLVIILIFTAGKSWQRRTDTKEIELLSQQNQAMQTKIQELEKSNTELQNTVASIDKGTQSSNNKGTTSGAGQNHVLQTAYNMREEASVDSDVLAEVDEGTTVKIIKMQDADWAQVEYNGITGYMKCGDELTSIDTGSKGSSGKTSSEDDSSDDSADQDAEE